MRPTINPNPSRKLRLNAKKIFTSEAQSKATSFSDENHSKLPRIPITHISMSFLFCGKIIPCVIIAASHRFSQQYPSYCSKNSINSQIIVRLLPESFNIVGEKRQNIHSFMASVLIEAVCTMGDKVFSRFLVILYGHTKYTPNTFQATRRVLGCQIIFKPHACLNQTY